MQDQKITIIGGGNLGVAMAEGLLDSGQINPQNLVVTRRKTHKIAHLAEKGIRVSSDNRAAVTEADTVILAVKPYQIKDVIAEIRDSLQAQRQVLVSVITGVTIAEMNALLGMDIPLLRAMPNTAMAVRESMTCLASKNASEEQIEAGKALFDLLGKSVFIEEELMAAATVLGACGIAYALRFVRAQSQGGIEIGFGAEIAQLIAAQTVKGASSLLLQRGRHPEFEIDKVTTPQGCTIAGLNEMEHQGFSSSLIKGIGTSYAKIADIAKTV